jgi:hypothetical protein
MLLAQLDYLIELSNEVATQTGQFFFVVRDDAPQLVRRAAMEKNLHP